MHGTRHSVRAVGIECISEIKRAPNAKHLRGMFPQAKADAAEAFSRPYVRLGIVLGTESRSLHCRDGYKAGDLRLNTSIFSPGWVLTGQAQAAVSRRIALQVKTHSTARKKWARGGYKSRNARRVTHRKSKTMNNKGQEGEGGADRYYTNGNLRTITRNSKIPGIVRCRRPELSSIVQGR